jgi:hypothetical protein
MNRRFTSISKLRKRTSFGDRLQPPAEPFADRLHVHGELPLSGRRTYLEAILARHREFILLSDMQRIVEDLLCPVFVDVCEAGLSCPEAVLSLLSAS